MFPLSQKGKAKAVGDGSGEANITKVQHFEDDDVLFKFCQNPDVLRYVSAIGACFHATSSPCVSYFSP